MQKYTRKDRLAWLWPKWENVEWKNIENAEMSINNRLSRCKNIQNTKMSKHENVEQCTITLLSCPIYWNWRKNSSKKRNGLKRRDAKYIHTMVYLNSIWILEKKDSLFLNEMWACTAKWDAFGSPISHTKFLEREEQYTVDCNQVRSVFETKWTKRFIENKNRSIHPETRKNMTCVFSIHFLKERVIGFCNHRVKSLNSLFALSDQKIVD